MALWLLRPIDPDSPPWEPWYDRCFGFVVRAPSEEKARAMTEGATGDEQARTYGGKGPNPWLDPALATCERLSQRGLDGIVMIDFHAV